MKSPTWQDGRTALHWAAWIDSLKVAEVLAAANANPDIKTWVGASCSWLGAGHWFLCLLCWWGSMGTPLLTTPNNIAIRQWSHCSPPNKRSAWKLQRFHSNSRKCSLNYHGSCNVTTCCGESGGQSGDDWFASMGWQYLSIPVFPYVGVAEYLGINTSVLQYCSIASVGAKTSSETEEVPRIWNIEK